MPPIGSARANCGTYFLNLGPPDFCSRLTKKPFARGARTRLAARVGVMAYLIATIAAIVGAATGWIAGNAADPLIAEYRGLLPDFEFVRRAVDALNLEMIGACAGLLIAASLAFRIYGGHRTLPALAW